MKVSISAIQRYSNFEVDEDIDRLVAKIGAQIGAVEQVEDYRPRYEGIYVVRVKSCKRHPNADKLSVCLIDDGGAAQSAERNEDGLIQVVCGAPNVRQGMAAVWISPGAVVPATADSDPFAISSRELREVMSNGMLASASELGIGSDHSGLLEIPEEHVGEDLAQPGKPFGQLYGLGDIVIEIENKMFTHRPDCFGVLGVAREISGVYGQQFHSPEWYIGQPDFSGEDKLPLEVSNQLEDMVPRFMAVAMDGVKIAPSPIWLQALLSRIGVKPINNIVDITNYISYVTGQPIHAYDYDKVTALSNGPAKLIVRYPDSSERIALLNGKTIVPRKEAIMIATEKELAGIGGVMGGTSTEVDEQTTRIIIECANFDMYSIRRTSMAHGLFTDAVTRFTKGQSLLQIPVVIHQALQMAKELSGAAVASNVVDVKSGQAEKLIAQGSLAGPIEFDAEFVNRRLGTELKAQEIASILSNVEIECTVQDETITVKCPFWRADLHVAEDIVEEIIRLRGFDSVPAQLPMRSVKAVRPDPKLSLKSRVRNILASMGGNELLTYSFVNEKLLKNAGQDPENAFQISNAISPELKHYRLSLLPSLLSHVHQNIKAGYDEFALFELNKVHIQGSQDPEENLPAEFSRIALVYVQKDQSKTGFYQSKKYLDELGYNLGVEFEYSPLTTTPGDQMNRPFEHERSADVVIKGAGGSVGTVGEFTLEVIKNFKLPVRAAGFEISVDALSDALSQVAKAAYQPLSRFPSIFQDICLEVPQERSYSEINNALQDFLSEIGEDIIASHTLIDIFKPKNSDKKRVTFRVEFVSYERTLSEDAATKIMDSLAGRMSQKIGSVRI